MAELLRRLRVGLIGAGAIAQVAQLPSLSAAADVTIAGVVTASPETTAANLARWPIEKGYETAEQMIEGARLDAVFVLTQKHLHTPFVRLGLDAGLDVFCEKPLATTLEDGRSIVELEATSAGLLMVGFNRRYAEVYQLAHKVFRDSPPLFITAQKNRRGTEYRATLENAIHMVDLLRWFGGEAVQVTAAAHADDPYREEGAVALISFDSGATAVLVAARCAGEWDERLDAYGDLTSVRVVAPDSVTVTRDGASNTIEMRPRANGWANVTVSAGFGPAVEHFLHCVRTREQPLTNAEEAFHSQQLMERILEAAGLPQVDDANAGR